jgi:anti-sigma factor RsiW
MNDIDKGCGEIKAKLVDYVDDGLSLEERLAVEVHIARCYVCREDVEEVARLLELCGAALRHPNPRDRFEELKQRLESGEPQCDPVLPRRGSRRRSTRHKLAVAAAVIVLLAASPFLVKGVIRLFRPVENSATLAGDGTDVGPLRHLLERVHFLRQSSEETAPNGEGNSVPDDATDWLDKP